jgi:hypothetical protein
VFPKGTPREHETPSWLWRGLCFGLPPPPRCSLRRPSGRRFRVRARSDRNRGALKPGRRPVSTQGCVIQPGGALPRGKVWLREAVQEWADSPTTGSPTG